MSSIFISLKKKSSFDKYSIKLFFLDLGGIVEKARDQWTYDHQ